MIDKHDIIFKLYANAVKVLEPSTDNFKAWDSSGNEISINMSNVNAELAKVDYKNKRQYPSMQEQFDLQYWDQVNGTTKWKEAIAKVKSDNPKP